MGRDDAQEDFNQVDDKCNENSVNMAQNKIIWPRILRLIRIHLTTGQFASKHGEAFRTGFISEFVSTVSIVFTVWICLTNTNFLMKFVRNSCPCFETNCPVVESILICSLVTMWKPTAKLVNKFIVLVATPVCMSLRISATFGFVNSHSYEDRLTRDWLEWRQDCPRIWRRMSFISTEIHKRRQIEKSKRIMKHGLWECAVMPYDIHCPEWSRPVLYTLDLVCSAIISVLSSESSVHCTLIWIPTNDSINASLIDA